MSTSTVATQEHLSCTAQSPGLISQKLTCLEFFAGIGLMNAGLRSQGWDCLYANDIEPKKKKMYESRFGKAEYYQVEDVWETEKIVANIPMGTVDLATASFPCVDLSLAGNLRGFSGAESGAFYGFIKVLKKLRQQGRTPRAILLENVLGFLTSHGGNYFRIALRELADLGYYADAFVIDAKHFTPQSRQRLFVIGFQPDLLTPQFLKPNLSWELQTRQDTVPRPKKLLEVLASIDLKTGWVPLSIPQLPAENRRLRDCIDIDEKQEWWEEKRVKKHIAEMHIYHRREVERLKDEQHYTVGTIYRRVRNGKSKSEVRLDGLAGCLRTPRGGSSKQIVLVVGKGELRMRWMTPREYARLQGCPEFPIEVERNEALWGFGDAVCVPVIEWIAKNVLTQILSPSEGTQPLQTPRN
jgi:DNA (cytosine-5)-methyltransferase 1